MAANSGMYNWMIKLNSVLTVYKVTGSRAEPASSSVWAARQWASHAGRSCMVACQLGMLIPEKLHSRVESCNSGRVSGAVAHMSKHVLGTRRETQSPTRRRVRETYRPAVKRGQMIGRLRGWSAHLMSALTRLWTVIFLVSYIEADWSGRICTDRPMQWHNYGHQRAAAETSVPFAPYRLDTPLSFVSRRQRPCIWYADHGHREANKRLTDSKCGATGDNYPAHNGPIVRRSLVSILASREISFPGSRKKIETLESR